MVVAACGPSSSGSGSSSGNVPSGPALAAVTPAGTKPVSSVVWATNRDVISLDPITSAGSPARVTVKLTQPDYWLEGELSPMPGIITITFGTTSQLAVVAGVTAAYLFSPWADQLGGTG